MYLKRKIYHDLLEWKENNSRSTLEIHGARQTGKTYIINKFADEHFNQKIYINLFDLSGKQFMECYRQAATWKPGSRRPEFPLHQAIRLYEPSFQDSPDTVVILDEIQESSEIYNCIREFTRQFAARFIVSGSYLGRVLEPEFKYASGDITKLKIYTLSFEEFLEALDGELYQIWRQLPLFQADDSRPQVYDQLKEAYRLYCRIGGYPKVVETYLEKRDILSAQRELVKIIQIFLEESMRYFKDITDISVFTNIFLSICRILLREKKGLEEGSVSEELQKLVVRNDSSNVSRETCNRAISWLYQSGIVGFCGKIIEMDVLDFKPGRRCYFLDPGVAAYYLYRTGSVDAVISGRLNENYVFINLLKRQDFPEEIAFETPAFATYKGGEIDYVVQTMKGQQRYLVEVKSGKGTAVTVKKALETGKADYLLYLKGDTKGGQEGKILTLPLYMLERFLF